MADQKLVDYVRTTLSQGHPPDSVRDALSKQGWDQASIDQAFAAAQGAGQVMSPAPVQQQTAQAQGQQKRPIGVVVICILGILASVGSILSGIAFLLLGSLMTGLMSDAAGADLINTFASLTAVISIVGLVTGVIGFVAYFMLFRMKKTGWFMVVALNVISIAVAIPSVNIITMGINGLILAYLLMKKSLFT